MCRRSRTARLVPLAQFVDDLSTPVSALPEVARRRPALSGVPAGVRRASPAGGPLFVSWDQPARGVALVVYNGDPYAIVADAVERTRQAEVAALPPFTGGAVGMFGYDLVRTVEPLGEPNPNTSGCPTSP